MLRHPAFADLHLGPRHAHAVDRGRVTRRPGLQQITLGYRESVLPAGVNETSPRIFGHDTRPPVVVALPVQPASHRARVPSGKTLGRQPRHVMPVSWVLST